jgi:hypothetical protein
MFPAAASDERGVERLSQAICFFPLRSSPDAKTVVVFLSAILSNRMDATPEERPDSAALFLLLRACSITA